MDDEARLRRIRYRAGHRGFREADLILGPFAETRAQHLDEPQLGRFEALLDAPDQFLFDWIMERAAAPAEHDHDVLAMVRAFRYEAHRAVG